MALLSVFFCQFWILRASVLPSSAVWQAIKEWIPDEEPDLEWFNRPRKPNEPDPDWFDQAPTWKAPEIHLDAPCVAHEVASIRL